MKEALAVLGAALILVSPAPYLIDIFRRKTKPNVLSWLTWSIMTAIGAAALFASHQSRAGWLLSADAAGTFSIALAGLRYGIAKVDTVDVLCIGGVLVGVILWQLLDSPLIAITTNVAIDLLATIPTLRHSWSQPDEETSLTFTLCAIAAIFTLLSLPDYRVSAWLYPLYLCLTNGAVAVAILHGQRRANRA